MTSCVKNVELINSQMKFKTTLLKSSLCDYSDAYILAKGRVTITGARAKAAAIFQNCAPFSDCISD